MEALNNMSIGALRAAAKAHNIAGRSSMGKAALVAALQSIQDAGEPSDSNMLENQATRLQDHIARMEAFSEHTVRDAIMGIGETKDTETSYQQRITDAVKAIHIEYTECANDTALVQNGLVSYRAKLYDPATGKASEKGSNDAKLAALLTTALSRANKALRDEGMLSGAGEDDDVVESYAMRAIPGSKGERALTIVEKKKETKIPCPLQAAIDELKSDNGWQDEGAVRRAHLAIESYVATHKLAAMPDSVRAAAAEEGKSWAA